MTIDNDLRQQLADATDLDDDIQVRVGAADEIRRTGNRMIRRRRIAVASVAVAVVGFVSGTAGLLAAGHHDRSAPPVAVRPPTPAETLTTRFVQPLHVNAITSQQQGVCRANELPAADGALCYSVAAAGGLAITQLDDASLGAPHDVLGTAPGTPQEQEIFVYLSARDKQALNQLTARSIGKQVAISLNGTVIQAPLIMQPLVNGELSLVGAPGFIEWVWLQLTGQLPKLTGHLPGSATPAQPPTDASPEAVVRAYVAAINRHDLATVLALLAAQKASRFNLDEDFTNIISMSKLTISPARNESSSYAASVGYRQVVHVPVDFQLRQRRVQSMPDGHTFWGYLLARNSASQPWRILDEGAT